MGRGPDLRRRRALDRGRDAVHGVARQVPPDHGPPQGGLQDAVWPPLCWGRGHDPTVSTGGMRAVPLTEDEPQPPDERDLLAAYGRARRGYERDPGAHTLAVFEAGAAILVLEIHKPWVITEWDHSATTPLLPEDYRACMDGTTNRRRVAAASHRIQPLAVVPFDTGVVLASPDRYSSALRCRWLTSKSGVKPKTAAITSPS